MKIVKSELKLLILSFISITFLLSCEDDITDVGSDLIPEKPNGSKTYVDVVAYNVSNNDTIRADYSTLTNGLIGIYEDNVFGKSKASFNIQMRLSDTDEIRGIVQEVDSVVLSIYPDFNSSSSTVTQESVGQNIKYITRYPLSSYLGQGSMDITVHRVNTFLESVESKFYSDKAIDIGDLLGTATLGTSVTSVTINDSDGAVVSGATKPGYRVKLDANYFKQNFFDKKGNVDISDNSRFIQYFRGIRISPVGDASKFMFSFPKNTITLIAYYRYKNAGETDFTSATYTFTLGSVYNSAVGEYNFYNRSTASSQFKQQMQAPDTSEGESKLFLQGMGGPSVSIKLNEAQLTAIKDSIQNNGWAIVGAKLNFYLAEDVVSKPSRIYGYNVTQKSLLPDLTSYNSLPGYSFNPAYNFTDNPGYYTLNITRYIKDIIEKNEPNDELLVEMGDFQRNSSGAYIGYYRTTRAYEPFRLIFHGNKASGDKKLQLEIIYTKN